jgi:uncharacterized protein YdbL (DUF1318 family)
MKTRILPLLLAVLMLAAAPALALDLHEARTQGIVGETPSGYVAAIKTSPDVQAFVDEINAKRKAEYARISKENNQPVDVVARIAAEKIISKLEPGQYYQAADGNWKKR